MSNSRVNRNEQNTSFLLPTTKLTNISCAFCRHQFFVRDFLHLRASFLPLLLNCGHAACHKCVKLHAGDACPLCSTASEHEVSYSNDLLPVNVYVTGLLAVMSAKVPRGEEPDLSFSQALSIRSKERIESSLCSECGTRAAIKCLQCNKLFCHTCVDKVHAKMEFPQQHFRVLLTNSREDSIFDTEKCTHHNRFVEWYCNDCENTNCPSCMMSFHRLHQSESLEEMNKKYMDDFMKAYEKLVEALQRVRQTQKIIRKKLVYPEESQSSVKMVETAINQHFAHLHGVLQNVERRMIDKLNGQRKDYVVNLNDVQQRLTTHEDQLQSSLQMAAAINEIIGRINLRDVVVELERLADVPCQLVQDPIADDEKIVFCPDPSIIETLENHCKIEIPKVPGFNLIPNNTEPTDYEAEPHSIQELPNILDESVGFNRTLMTRASSCQSLSSRRSDARHLRKGGTCLVNVCYIESPSNFYVRQVAYQNQIKKLERTITNYVKRNFNVPSEVNPNDLYLVKRADKNKWYRGRVIAINTILGAPDTYNVFNVDYGFTETQVPISRMRHIRDDMATLPQMAINCSLYDIVPIDGKWHSSARKLLCKITRQGPEHAVTLHVVEVKGNTYYVDICGAPPKDGQFSQVSARDSLIFLGFGAFVDSQFLRRTCPLSVRRFICTDIPVETYFTVMCSHVESPDCIYVQKVGDHLSFLYNLVNDMVNYYKHMKFKYDEELPGYIPEIGQPCAVEYSEGQWFRGTVNGIPRARTVEAFLVDFGQTVTIPYEKIHKLHEKFMMSPTQAIKVTLADIKPIDGQWCEEAIQFTKRNIEHKYARVFPFEKTESGYNVAFYIGNEGNGKNLAGLLVGGGLALRTGHRSTGQAEMNISQSSQTNSSAKVRNSRTTKRKKFNSDRWVSTKSSSVDVATDDPYRLPVKIVRVVSPDTIYVCDTSLEKEYEQMMREMQKFYNKYKDVSNNCNWQMNHPCAVYSSRDRCFCRGEITAFKSEEEVEVFLYDLALTETVPISELQALKKKFWITPTYVCKVKLAGILPCGGSSVWPGSSCDKLKDFISESQHSKFYISKVDVPGEDALNVDLWVEKIKIDGPLLPARIELNSINRMLVDAGMALPIKQYNEKKTKVLAIELKRQISFMDESSKNDSIDWTTNGDFKERQTIATAGNSVENDESFVESSAASSISNDLEDASSFFDGSTTSEDSLMSNAYTLTTIDPKVHGWLPAEPIREDKFLAVATNLDNDCSVRLYSKKESDHVLRFIAKTLHAEYSTSKVQPYDLDWKVGELCIAQYHGNKKWYRAQVVRMTDNNMIEVEFIDYGNLEECENGTLRKRLTLTNIPRQCTKCAIAGLVPNTPNGKWRIHDLDKIHALLVEKECEVTVLKRKPDHLVVSINLLTPTRRELSSYLLNELRMDIQANFVEPGCSNDESESTIENSRDVIVVGYVKNQANETIDTDNNKENTMTEKDKTIENIEDDNAKIEETYDTEKTDENGEKANDKIKRNEKSENDKTNEFSVNADLSGIVSASLLEKAPPHVNDHAVSTENIVSLNYKTEDAAISGSVNFTHSADKIEMSLREAMVKLESEAVIDYDSIMESEIITSTPFNDSLVVAPKAYKSLKFPKDVKIVKAEVVLVGLTKAWLHLLNNRTSEIICELRNLYEMIMQDMQDRASNQPLLKNFEKNMPCCAKFEDGKWYRCKVVERGCDPHGSQQKVQVRFVDWGNTDRIRCDELRVLKDEWLEAPCMAFRCRLWRMIENATGDSDIIRQIKVQKAWKVGEKPPKPVYVKIEAHSGPFYDVQIYTDGGCTKLIYQSLIDDGLFVNKSTKLD